jgi:hypothetical protein
VRCPPKIAAAIIKAIAVNVVHNIVFAASWITFRKPHDLEMEVHGVNATRAIAAIAASTPKIWTTAVIFDVPFPLRKVLMIFLVEQRGVLDMRVPQPLRFRFGPRVGVPKILVKIDL